jgi:uncharacterized protein YcfJ
MKRWMIISVLALASLALAAVASGTPGHGHGHGTFHKTFTVTTADHGCAFRVWATDHVKRTFTVSKQHKDGSYTVRRHDRGTFTTTGPLSPSADPCPDVIRKGKHGTTLQAGVVGKMHGYIVGTVTGGTFIPTGTCAAECTNAAFIAGFFTAGSQFTCSNGYAGCRFEFKYTAQRHHQQHLRYHHWVDRGLNGVNETFIGDIATA